MESTETKTEHGSAASELSAGLGALKVFRVVTERDGETTKEPGRTSTAIDRREFRYAAETMQDVWDEIAWMRNDPEETLIASIEEAPAITVVRPNVEFSGPPRSEVKP